MILVTGGAFQGKEEFVRQRFLKAEESFSGAEIADGKTASLEEILSAGCVKNLHLFVKRMIEEGAEDIQKLAGQLYENHSGRIIITDEIGCGIVPVSAAERRWREETGRLCCLLAKQADEVWRVSCGIGVQIKGSGKEK